MDLCWLSTSGIGEGRGRSARCGCGDLAWPCVVPPSRSSRNGSLYAACSSSGSSDWVSTLQRHGSCETVILPHGRRPVWQLRMIVSTSERFHAQQQLQTYYKHRFQARILRATLPRYRDRSRCS